MPGSERARNARPRVTARPGASTSDVILRLVEMEAKGRR
jgi:hypothetical protein